jgi:hypothetical protein
LSGALSNTGSIVKVRVKKVQIYLVIAIVFILQFPAFMDYYDSMKDSFSLPAIMFENPGQETISPDCLNRSMVFGTNRFSAIFPRAAHFFDPLSESSFQIASLDQETFLLRC